MENKELVRMIELFDIAIKTDNKMVKDALQNLLCVATLVSEEGTIDGGPFKLMLDRILMLESTVNMLSNRLTNLETARAPSYPYGPTITPNTNYPFNPFGGMADNTKTYCSHTGVDLPLTNF